MLCKFFATFPDLDSVGSGYIRLLNQSSIRTLFFAHDAITVLNSRVDLICEVIAIFDCKQKITAVSEKGGLERL